MRRAWLVPAAIALAIAVRNLADWVAIAASGLPIGYGEGAVVHAGQLLARGADPYAADQLGFVSANYPPLGYVLVALGLPLGAFAGLRLANIVAACAIAALVAWRARSDAAVAMALGAAFLALYPVGAWVPGNRVDVAAVALTALAVTALRVRRGGALLFGVLGALALFAKPTAAAPLAAVVAYLAWRDRATAARAVTALVGTSGVGLALTLARFEPRGLYEHLVVNNALPYDPRNPVYLLVLAALLLGAFVAVAFRHADGTMRAYLVGAIGVVLLGGHEGATYNYLLDLAVASCVALAPLARSRPGWAPALLTGQLLATLVLTSVGHFVPPSLEAQAARVAVVSGLPRDGTYYAEDSGLLIAAGLEPVVDDVYVWARLVALGVRADDVTPRVEARTFTAILSDVPLDAVDVAPEFQRKRWPARLVEAVLRNYALEASARGAYRYVPRR